MIKTIEGPHGSYTMGKPYCERQLGFTSWFRLDHWTGKDGFEEHARYFVAGPDDYSEHVNTYNGSPNQNAQYGFDCSCCYLGIAHTLDRHNLNK